jgi:hypothetical protein
MNLKHNCVCPNCSLKIFSAETLCDKDVAMSRKVCLARLGSPAARSVILITLVWTQLGSAALGQGRRAFLVAIDRYRAATESEKAAAHRRGIATPGRGDYAFGPLDGTVNDIESIRDVLIHMFGFSKDSIYMLENEEATRQAIIDGMRKYFIDQAKDGDVLFFYYAGHGSQVRNSASYKADKQDETIVPWDANAGVWDIRDKEIARLFNESLDKHKVTLTAIFDSCHSGSIARGLPSAIKVRSIPGDSRDANDDYRATPPEDRGVLIISAAQFNESASEDSDVHEGKSIPHGAFTLALVRAFNRVQPNTPARDLFRTARVTLHASGFAQEPVLAGNDDRLSKGIFGDLSGVSNSPKVLVQDITDDGKVTLDGGFSLGLEPKAELRSVAKRGEHEIRLRVLSVNGLSSCIAEPIDSKDLVNIKKLDAFAVDRWSFPGGATLTVWLPPHNLSLQQVEEATAEFAKLRGKPGLTWVKDPTETTPSHVVSWNGKQWQLQSPGRTYDLGEKASVASLMTRLQAEPPSDVNLFVYLPPAAELAQRLSLGPDSENSAVDVADSSAKGKYWLVGRIADGTAQYAWVRPNATREGAESEDLPLLVRSDWLKAGDSELEQMSAKLLSHLQGIGRVVGWMTLPSPPDDGNFPYRLALRDAETGAWITGSELQSARGTVSEKSERIATPTVKGGQRLQVILKAEPDKLAAFQEPRKVYVFAIDSFGQCLLLFPRGADDQRNLMPYKDAEGHSPPEVPVRTVNVTAPWGVDSYIMLTTEKPIGDLTVFECQAVRTRGAARDANNPLTNLLRRNATVSRGIGDETPANWSIQRLPLRSIPGSKPN